jgi:rhodanese-related sulfurtransferase
VSPADDPQQIDAELEHLSLVAIEFPSFTDGRGYSIARLLRERHHWRGELRAVGEVLRDQLQSGTVMQAARQSQRPAERLNMQASNSDHASRDNHGSAASPGYAGDVTPGEAWNLMQTGTARMLDVRTAEELRFVGSVPGSLHVPWAIGIDFQRNPDFVNQVLQVARREDKLMLLCRSAKRSLSAARALTQAGFTQVYNILEGFEGDMDGNERRGSINGWRLRGLPWRQS